MSWVWLWIPAVGPIRTSTVLAALVLFITVLIVRRDLLRAVAVVPAWAGLFETLYHLVGILGYHWPIANFVWMTAAVAGWIILTAVLGIWPDWRVSIAFVLLMGTWVAAGFHYNVAGQSGPINVFDEVLNAAAKTTLAVAYLVGAIHSPTKPDLLPFLISPRGQLRALGVEEVIDMNPR